MEPLAPVTEITFTGDQLDNGGILFAGFGDCNRWNGGSPSSAWQLRILYVTLISDDSLQLDTGRIQFSDVGQGELVCDLKSKVFSYYSYESFDCVLS